MENQQEKSQEQMVKEAVEEAKKAAAEKDAQESEATEDTEQAETVSEADGEADPAKNGEAEEPENVEEETEAGDEEESGQASDRKLFGRKNKKDKRDEKIEELTDKLTRQMAEFDNFRKRTEKEKSHMYEIGAKDIIDKIIPVLDNFERGLGGVKEEEKNNPFIQGMEMVYKQLMTTLEGAGVTVIEAAGREFNPDFHNAVMHVDDETVGENIIVEELQKGYMYRDTVVRYSMVKVAN